MTVMPEDTPPNKDARAQPDRSEVRAELERILGSRAFEQAGRASQFLRFVVEEALAGRADRLKGYAIAVSVFDRPEDFDAQADPVVRVEAGRLRRRLMEYYLDEGRDNAVRIELPRGGYAPAFRYPIPTSSYEQASALPVARPIDGRRGFTIAAIVLPVLALAAWLLSSPLTEPIVETLDDPEPPAIPAPSQAQPRLLVLPIADLSGSAELERFARGLTEEVIQAFVDLRIVEVASPAAGNAESTSLSTLREQFDAGYALTGNIRMIDDTMRIAVRLIETDAGTQLWARTFDESLMGRAAVNVQESIALALGVIIASPYGPIYAHEIERIADRPIDELTAFECVLRFYGYVQKLDVAGHAEARACLLRAVDEEPEYAEAWSSLATLHLHEHSFGFNPLSDAPPALDRALEAARRSLDLDGSGRVVAVTLIGIRHAAGDLAGFERAVERASSMKPQHPAVLAHIGFLLTLSGDWQRGIPMLDQAIPLTVNPPTWLLAAYAFRYLETHQYTEALDWALRIDTPNWFVASMTVAAAAALAGRPDIAERESARLRELYPTFASAGPAQLDEWGMNEPLVSTVLEGLSRAGFSFP